MQPVENYAKIGAFSVKMHFHVALVSLTCLYMTLKRISVNSVPLK
jgi:hypothetical protein